MQKKLFLIDGMAVVYRAYFGLIRNPRINSKGENVSAVFGFINTLLDIMHTYEPTHIAVAFDTHEPTFRHIEYPEYKATRDETPEGIRTAVPHIRNLLTAFNIPVLEYPGFEADDVIGTLARQAEQQGFDTYMVTPDKDYAQLVDEHTFMLKPGSGKSGELLDVAKILEQWNIAKIEQVIDILGLAGDAADNIPGIPGIGPKTAQKLIAEYGSIENLLEHTDELKGKQKEKVEDNKAQALLSKRLVTIKSDVPVKENPAELIMGVRNDDQLKVLFSELEFKSLIKRLFGESPSLASVAVAAATEGQGDLFEFAASAHPEMMEPLPQFDTIKDVKHNYHLVTTAAERDALVSKLAGCYEVCFDTETTGLDVRVAELIGISFCIEPHEAWFVTLPPDREQALLALEPFLPILQNPDVRKVGQNLKYDVSILKWHGIEVRGELLDTMLAHYLIDPDQRHNMDHMAESLLNYSPVPITALIGEKKSTQKTLRDVDLDELCEYGAEDADITLQLWHKLKPMLKERGQERVFYEIETPLMPVLATMEYNGVNLDVPALGKFSAELGIKIHALESAIYTMAGMEFNLNSPKQVGEVLFDLLKLVEKPKKTKTGQYKTDEEVLSSLAPDHEIVRKMLDYRGLTKLKSTYVDALPLEVFEGTGRLHTTYSQAVTTTGRLSSVNPNLQNIPIRTEDGREIRRAFIPREGFTLLACDYSQIELRIMAELSGDAGLREAFIHGEDIHTATAARVFGVGKDDVTREMRSKAKMVNFGIIYGISAFGLAQRLGIGRKEAQEIIEQYRANYPGVQGYLDSTIEFAQQHEYVETITGRRRYIRDINARNQMVRGGAERNAINAPIQGTAADMIKIAMIAIQKMLEEKKSKTKLLLQVHDELVFDLALDEKDDLLPLIEEKMKSAIPMEIPILVESGTGENWLEAH
ncbi:DNA polymerase I [Pontiella sulfatireligans]|uniref:DNA polymerase I n=1 Tax=Pontiella sulfatireligans TaxID=2750658 RepID=A0A6C2UL89_9BACT|nr:DNA polymerase I [Pontiella sulfatireligans]VGO21005.1 DNA polymerase I [Pontiella sulfatireligans]